MVAAECGLLNYLTMFIVTAKPALCEQVWPLTFSKYSAYTILVKQANVRWLIISIHANVNVPNQLTDISGWVFRCLIKFDMVDPAPLILIPQTFSFGKSFVWALCEVLLAKSDVKRHSS